MAQAYIFIEAQPGKALDLVKNLTGIAGVKEAHAVTGPWDVIALIEAADIDKLGDIVVTKIQQTGKVTRTITNLIVH